MSSKNLENNVAAGASEMKYPNMLDSAKIDWTALKTKKQKVVMRDTGTGKIFGSKVVYQPVVESSFLQELRIIEGDLTGDHSHHIVDGEDLPDIVISQIKSNIRKGAKDLKQNWANAIELTNKAYEVASVARSSPHDKHQWKQYEKLIQFAVMQLADARGMHGHWRMTSLENLD